MRRTRYLLSLIQVVLIASVIFPGGGLAGPNFAWAEPPVDWSKLLGKPVQLIGYWGLDETGVMPQTVSDASGNKHNGKVNSPDVTTGAPGQTKTAYKFDGPKPGNPANGTLPTIPYDQGLNASAFILEGYIKFDRNYYRSQIDTKLPLDKQTFALGLFGRWFGDDAVVNVSLLYVPRDNAEDDIYQIGAYLKVGTPGKYEYPFVAANLAPNAGGQWTHIALVYDGGQAQLYINGVPQEHPDSVKDVGALAHPQSKSPLGIGWAGSAKYAFHGEIDEVKLWRIVTDETSKPKSATPTTQLPKEVK